MLEGKCPKCGYYCIGWALAFPRNQSCPRCGVGLEITEGGRKVSTGYSPFTAKRYSIDLPNKIPFYSEKDNNSHKESKQDRS